MGCCKTESVGADIGLSHLAKGVFPLLKVFDVFLVNAHFVFVKIQFTEDTALVPFLHFVETSRTFLSCHLLFRTASFRAPLLSERDLCIISILEGGGTVGQLRGSGPN